KLSKFHYRKQHLSNTTSTYFLMNLSCFASNTPASIRNTRLSESDSTNTHVLSIGDRSVPVA
ncbi:MULTISPECIES: hypothetical protein, partial [Nostoc]|uniref:hypothetical protein n=1 Tax=Nostoc TaxID=1177 RepID=UPI001A7E6B83